MKTEEINQLIDEIVKKTIKELKSNGMIKQNKTAYEKTEDILKSYMLLKTMTQQSAIDMVNNVDAALETIKSDIYYGIIPMIYFEEKTREEVAEKYKTSERTISRNKRRLVEKLKLLIMSEETINEWNS